MIVEILPENPDQRKIKQVVECLKSGGVIIYPTDTVYSIGCDIENNKAIERIARLKNVRADKANFSLVCHDLSHITEYSRQVSNSVFKMMKRALPGPYTFILEAGKKIPSIFSDRKKTIGIRVPDHLIPREIVKELGRPIIATSVHDDDEIIEYTTDPNLIHEKFEHLVDMVIDGGFCGLEASTVLDCTGAVVTVIREGKGTIDFI
ncbi:MAG: threonylcarbamoyl-AMP synthase [Flavobacteriales bacterium]|nr:threonylcarbamoyl-AMP synthase [Flavobacteriales bacterium]